MRKMQKIRVLRSEKGTLQEAPDFLALEEPLEIRIQYGPARDRHKKKVAVTMRTPGDDVDLALGFLFTEGIIRGLEEVASWKKLAMASSLETHENIIEVDLHPSTNLDTDRIERLFIANSSCGICGKGSIDAVYQELPPDLPKPALMLSTSIIHKLPATLRAAQDIFSQTGGIHAAALFDLSGNLIRVKEDIGRHNALDKLIGAGLRERDGDMTGKILFLSGRCGFELVQKALMAGIQVIASVGAPSSLAVNLADENGMTLLGFVRDHRFNIYCGAKKVAP